MAMMSWLRSLDVALFRFINETLSNSLFDRIMPFFSGNSVFVPLLVALAAILVWKKGARGRVCLIMLALVICLGDPLIVNTLKHAIGRLRPFNEIPDAITRVGRGGSFSMPSAHTANWFAAATVFLFYFRRSVFFMLPLAGLVGFSRIYNGVHYPSDVLVGAVLGVAYALALVWSIDAFWRWAGQRWFPLWWTKLTSLRRPELRIESVGASPGQSPIANLQSSIEEHWLRLGWALIVLVLFVRLAYLATGRIELSEDEAYQWLWAKHPALSYYSKPPLIAYTQLVGTTLWGDNAFGVRFFSPVIAAAVSLILLRFCAREINARLGTLLILGATAIPLLAVGATLMTIDSLAVLFWTAAMISGWRAIRLDSTRHWVWTGLWMALGFLSKYTSPLQWLCWAVFFSLWKPARAQWKRPGPYLALLVNALGTLPVLIWNAQHGWITLTHLEDRGGLDTRWHPTLRYLTDFLGDEIALLNPVFFVGVVWAAIAFWRLDSRTPLMVYLFSMGAPVFLFYLTLTLRARALPNWIAVSVVPLFCLAALYWDSRWRLGARAVKAWLVGSVGLGLVVVVALHDTDLVGKITGRPLPPKRDPLTRVRGWKEMTHKVAGARSKLLAQGKPVFIIGNHYGITSLIAFYLPEAKAAAPDRPLVYFRSSNRPENQFYFWPGYQSRKGQNAIFVQEVHTPQPPPDRIRNEFASVTDLGLHDILYRDRVVHQIELFECRDLR